MTTAQRDDVLIQISVDVKGLTVAIEGNGTKGLNDRVDDLENDKGDTAIECGYAEYSALAELGDEGGEFGGLFWHLSDSVIRWNMGVII